MPRTRKPPPPRCPRCNSGKRALQYVMASGANQYRCRACNRMYSDQSTTNFRDMRTPIKKRNKIIAALQADPDVSTSELARIGGVAYVTARAIRLKALEGDAPVFQGKSTFHSSFYKRKEDSQVDAPKPVDAKQE